MALSRTRHQEASVESAMAPPSQGVPYKGSERAFVQGLIRVL